MIYVIFFYSFGGYAKIQSIVSSLASRLSTRDLYKQVMMPNR